MLQYTVGWEARRACTVKEICKNMQEYHKSSVSREGKKSEARSHQMNYLVPDWKPSLAENSHQHSVDMTVYTQKEHHGIE